VAMETSFTPSDSKPDGRCDTFRTINIADFDSRATTVD
jgi:hypothetical protein